MNETDASIENQLALMAADPNIQRELQKIERDFACTESDGLEVKDRVQ